MKIAVILCLIVVAVCAVHGKKSGKPRILLSSFIRFLEVLFPLLITKDISSKNV